MEQAHSRKSILIGTSLHDNPVSNQFAALGRELVERGYPITLLVQSSRYDRANADPRIAVLTWPSTRPTGFADARFFDKVVAQSRPGCIISNFGANNVMVIVAALRRVPVRVHWYHTLSTQIDQDWRGSSFLRLWLLRLRARLTYTLATHTVANSQAAKRDALDTFGVSPAHCTVFWNCLRNPGTARSVAGTRLGRQRFLCVGRFNRSKGQDVLVRAMAEVARRLPSVRLDFVGDGPGRKECEQLAHELGVAGHCSFAGGVPHPEVLSRMAGAWATVVPSRAEAFGLVNIESLAVGTPVIGSATGGIAEIVRDRVDGLLFPPGDHKALARCMIELAQNQALRNQMSVSCRQRFLDHFELSRAVKTQADWLCGLIENKSRTIEHRKQEPVVCTP